MSKADLHIHTTASDGKSEPAQIISLALKHSLQAIAITDHDTVRGFLEAQALAADHDLEVVPGVEITSLFNGRESHLLAYYFDPGHPGLQQLLQNHKKARIKRGVWIVNQLTSQGLDVDISEVKAEANGTIIGRPHIASVLVNKGYVASFKEAFIRYLSNDALGSIKSEYYSYKKVIDVIKDAGGIVIIAHPGRLYSEEELEQFVEAGIDGIEVLHPSHNYETQKAMEEFGERHNLLTTGGSDYHGGNDDYQKYFGIITINSNKVERIKKMALQRKQISVS